MYQNCDEKQQNESWGYNHPGIVGIIIRSDGVCATITPNFVMIATLVCGAFDAPLRATYSIPNLSLTSLDQVRTPIAGEGIM